MQAWQAAADEAEREALMARVQALMQEKGDLQGGEDGGRAAPVRR
jgi:hypothetical protein